MEDHYLYYSSLVCPCGVLYAAVTGVGTLHLLRIYLWWRFFLGHYTSLLLLSHWLCSAKKKTIQMGKKSPIFFFWCFVFFCCCCCTGDVRHGSAISGTENTGKYCLRKIRRQGSSQRSNTNDNVCSVVFQRLQPR